MTNRERMVEVLQQSIPEIVDFFESEFNCPPLNDRYNDGCRNFGNCFECWKHWLKSEVTIYDN